MQFKPVVVIGLALLVLMSPEAVPGQSQSSSEKALIVPIYFQLPPLYTTFDITEVQGRQVDVKVEEYTSYGDRTVSKTTGGGVEENDWWLVHASHFIDGTGVDNGWARILYPEDREVRVVATMIVKDDPEASAHFAAVPPAPSFRLMAWHQEGPSNRYSPRGETAVVIVNPTEEEQNVSLVFYGWDLRKGHGLTTFSTRRSIPIAPRHSLSRFLTELVPPIVNYANEGYIRGLLKVSGETEIAVGALDYFRDTGRFRSVPVISKSVVK